MPSPLILEGTVIDQTTAEKLSKLKVQIRSSRQPSGTPLATAVTDANGQFIVQLNVASQKLAQSVQFKVLQGTAVLEVVADKIVWGGRASKRTVTIPVVKASSTGAPERDGALTDPAQLKFLARNAKRTLRQVEQDDGELVESLRGTVRSRLRKRVAAHFESASPALRKFVVTEELIPDGNSDLKISDILLKKLTSRRAPEKVVKEARQRLRRLKMPRSVDSALMLDGPMRQNPAVMKALRQGAVYLVGEMASVPEEKATVLVEAGLSVSDISNKKLAELVEAGKLVQTEASSLGLTSSLYSLFEEEASVVEALQKTPLEALGGNTLSDLKELVQVNSESWTQFLKTSGVSLPEGMSAENYGRKLARTVETIFPTDFFMARIAGKRTGSLSSAIEKVQPLLERNQSIFKTKKVESLDWGTLERDKESIVKSRQEILEVVNLYPGLRLLDVLDNAAVSAAEKTTVVESRIALLETFQKNNDQFELLHLDFSVGSADLEKLNYSGLSETNGDKEMVLSTLKAYQRIYTAAADAESAATVLKAGYSSAQSIAKAGASGFQKATGLDEATVDKIMVRAQLSTTVSAGAAMAVGDVLSGGLANLGVGNISPHIQEYFKDITGFADLFGSQDYCKCAECGSIFGAAAYFVDLMYLIESSVLTPVFEANGLEDHLLHLKNRRPDLWTLELTCENTNEMIPQLVIVCEILEDYIARKLDSSIDTSDRAKVESIVYGDTLPSTDRSFQQPFLLPLKKLEIYLGHLESTRGAIAATLGQEQQIVTRATLGLSLKEHELITTPNESLSFLETLYRVDFATGSSGDIEDVDSKEFLSPMNVDRSQLEELLDTEFVRGDTEIEIESQKGSVSSVQNDVERITGLTTGALDRLHRFARLQKKLSWSVPELDLLLSQFKAAGATELNAEVLDSLVNLRSIQDVVSGSVELLCAFWGNIPNRSISDDEDGLFDQLFNGSNFTEADGTYPKDSTSYVHPWHRTSTSTSADLNTSRLTSGLKLTEQELYDLIVFLASALGMAAKAIPSLSPSVLTPTGSILAVSATPAMSFKLTSQNLSLLYRHAALKKQLGLSLQELFQLIAQVETISSGFVSDLDDLKALIAYYTWRKESSWSADEISYVTSKGDVQDASAVPDPYAIALDLFEKVQSDGALVFADTALAYVEGITEETSKAIIQENLGSLIEEIVESDGTVSGYRLTALPSSSAVTIPTDVTADAVAVANFLTKYHVTVIVPNYLGTLLGISAEKVQQLFALAGIDLAAASYTEAIRDSAGVSTFENAITLMARLQVLYSDELFTPEVLVGIQAHKEIFGISDFTAISISGMQSTDRFTRSVEALGDTDGTSVLSILDLYDTSTSEFESEPLRDVLGTAAEGLLACQAQLDLPENALEALDRIQQGAALAEKLGLDAETLKRCVADEYDDLTSAAAVVAGVINSASEDEEDEAIESLDESLLNTRRDALVDYLVAYGSTPSFKDADELYRYFLIDTQVDGCFETSRVVCAISSLQLYIQRVRLNLEQDESGKLVENGMSPELIDDSQWSWRKNYRLWQANRKVFVYPENYIEPDLRDDKTPLFEELESELLQQDITEQNVLDAYGTYLEGFEQLATLKIAGAYHDIAEDGSSDILHLFGVTQKDPPVIYYRKINNLYSSGVSGDPSLLSWEAWQEVDLKVPVRKVSPIVFKGKLYLFWVEISSRSVTDVDDGTSAFTGYKHELKIYYSYLRLDGTWATAQRIALYGTYPFKESEGIVDDPLIDEAEAETIEGIAELLEPFGSFMNVSAALDSLISANPEFFTPKYDDEVHYKAQEGYTLEGFQWEQVYPDFYRDHAGKAWIALCGCNYQLNSRIDLLGNETAGLISADAVDNISDYGAPFSSGSDLPSSVLRKLDSYVGRMPVSSTATFEPFAYCSLFLEQDRLDEVSKYWVGDTEWTTEMSPLSLYFTLNSSEDEVAVINGAYIDALIDSNGDLFHVQASGRNSGCLLRRIGTTLSEQITSTLFEGGVSELLDTDTQRSLTEDDHPFVLENATNGVVSGEIDFAGPYGAYYREIFFHIPFLIANHLNSQGEYESAQKWYHYIFNPTSTELITDSASAKDRNWRYLEFRGLDVPSLREILSDSQAIDAYLNNPFNPDAIARLRMTAYQKAIVMKYVDNLLDWADELFTHFEMETVNEAIMLYVFAADILGDRPAEVGDCGEGPKNYEEISSSLDQDSQFLVEMEHFSWSRKFGSFQGKLKNTFDFALDRSVLQSALSRAAKTSAFSISTVVATNRAGANIGSLSPTNSTVSAANIYAGLDNGTLQLDTQDRFDNLLGAGTIGPSILSGVPIFCVPQNETLLAYWDRVEDRLYKIRNCMDITGTKRSLSLFAPEIDPGLLVRAKAAGLDLEDVLNSVGGDLPPYRFTCLVEKAKSYAGTVQSFGNALQSALQQKDAEELNQLRTTHEQNILKLTTSLREWEIEAAEASLESVENQKTRAEHRRDYYQELLDGGLSGWEAAEQVGRHAASITRGLASTGFIGAGIARLFPNVGSPFAMTYGGEELGNAASLLALSSSELATLGESMAASAGLEATFQRRKEEWQFQVDQAEDEISQIEKEITAAELRKEIAEKSLEIHEKTQEQTEEIAEFYADKFTSLGLYTWLSTELQRLFRDAYNSAYRMAQLTEQAFHFERPDDSTVYVGSNWDSSRSGLLAGESLLMNLQTMEQKFVETNYQDLEITQSFSLLQINPTALLSLKENATCTFVIPEFFFDLLYPGQYYRLIKSVRLTIPCVTGPYTNVSATLKLVASKVRTEPATGDEALTSVPPTRSTMIAASTGNQDAGVFELNFEGPRYAPFEGAGAAESEWQLELPKNFRGFNYDTITDVIIHVSYTAQFDGTFRTEIEGELNKAEGQLLAYATANSLYRFFSLKRDFSSEFYRLRSSALNTEVAFAVGQNHFPFFLQGRDVKIVKATLYLDTDGYDPGDFEIAINGVTVSTFEPDATGAQNSVPLHKADVTRALPTIFQDHSFVVKNSGGLSPATGSGSTSAIDVGKLSDAYLHLEYRLTS